MIRMERQGKRFLKTVVLTGAYDLTSSINCRKSAIPYRVGVSKILTAGK